MSGVSCIERIADILVSSFSLGLYSCHSEARWNWGEESQAEIVNRARARAGGRSRICSPYRTGPEAPCSARCDVEEAGAGGPSPRWG